VAKAVFFDRDGTLIQDKHYIARPEDVELCPGAPEALREAEAMGFEAVVVSNQSGVARGFFDEAAVRAVNDRMIELLGAAPRAIYCCFHLPGGLRPEYAIECECRKPKPGLLNRAARELGIALEDSFLVGDSLRDLMAARAAGVRTILVLSGEAAEYVKTFGKPTEADFMAAGLGEAMAWIRDLHKR
jgi:D-glycero-D-manno-heptose 1,7-bisphosphate phosphatase